jgi:Ca2+-binding RTX toxin-like protein
MNRLGLVASLAAVAVLGAVPASAIADLEVSYTPFGYGGEVDVIDVDGTPNDASVSQGADVITVTDALAGVTPVDPCVGVTANTVNCPLIPPAPDPAVTTLFADLGDGGDRFAFVTPWSFEENTVETGLGDDEIIGSDVQDFLTGGAGNDTILALAGDDELFGQAGDDSLNGGEGFDFNDCGAGFDVALVDPFDTTDSDCERSGSFVLDDSARVKNRNAKLTLDCPAAEAPVCAGTLALYNGDKTVGEGTFSVPAGEALQVKGRLKKGVARKLHKEGSLFVNVESTTTEPGGEATNSTRVLLLG